MFDLNRLVVGTSTLDDGTVLTVTRTEPGSFSYKSGDYTVNGYTYNRVTDAEWVLPSGVHIHARNAADRVTYRNYRANDRTPQRELNKKPRVYAHADVPFNVLEDLENRGRRPHKVYRPLVIEALAQIGLTGVKLNWSQYAGCTCPCSPGFILTPTTQAVQHGLDIWVTLPSVPTIDDAKPGRKIVLA